MQSLKSASLIRRSLRISPFKSSYRSLTSLSTNALSNDSDDIVLVEGKACSRTAILNRPPVLNALNTAVGARLQKLYKSWEDNPDIGFVMLKGSERAFCAGGDIVSLYHLINEGNIEACKDFCRTVYGFIYHLGTYLKPHVFATPETLIGFHPDAGASFYLSHLPGYLGEYLALTGDKLNGVEMIGCGLATHYSLSARLPLLEEQLGKLVTDDPSVIETSLGTYSDVVYPDSTSVLHRIETLDKCFSHDTVEEIIDSLESEAAKSHDDWCASTLKKLKYVSPLSLKVSLRSIREGRYQTFDRCLVREYRMSLQGMSKQISNDFCEGVRARMVDKDLAPKALSFDYHDLYGLFLSRLKTAVEPSNLGTSIDGHGRSVFLPS
ncbi:3-hydroxyisobutyryl-CoA hydrolase-like protein 1, mitochondrial isoform X5 [Rhododendron vialii]|uniref:3-hydroxyisobutyryl-CoA hydrolase-like protein 1, mitochondrial isoform X5 n=1 Tax=Rhododendron vialii TaxID=182163 RepID=UPI0026602F75|nr:3-hydroxyisobutyryl-CoA hydrolase-like protein 1, mitochondrial isoform X5 [Rhododendron vialii]